MCEYIRDNGEQCEIDSHDGRFCHVHDDMLSDDVSDVQNGFDGQVMDTNCSNCETPLRRCERLTEHPNKPHSVVFEAVVVCDCSEEVLGSKTVSERNTPNGWL